MNKMLNKDKLSLEFLNPDECDFSFNDNGFLVFSLKGENKGRVKLIRTYPYSLTDEYICVHDLEDNELGIILNLNELNENASTAAKKELENRYYCPTITAVKSIKERMGHFYFETIIDLNERDQNGKPVFSAEKVMKEMAQLSKVHEQLVALEAQVKQELEVQAGTRANVDEGFDPGNF